MKKLTIWPLWFANWIHKKKGKKDYRIGVAKVDEGEGKRDITSTYLIALEAKKNMLIDEILGEYQVDISDETSRLRSLRERVKVVHESHVSEVSSEDGREVEEKNRVEEAIRKKHKKFINKKLDVQSTYDVLEKFYLHGVEIAKEAKGGKR